jgi:hypothetical protein
MMICQESDRRSLVPDDADILSLSPLQNGHVGPEISAWPVGLPRRGLMTRLNWPHSDG